MDMVILAAWQLYKIRELETFAAVDLEGPGRGRSEKVMRYRGANERLLFGSLNQLRAIQQERAQMRVEREAALPEQVAPRVLVRPPVERVEKLKQAPKVMRAGVEGTAGAATALRRALALRRVIRAQKR